MIKLKDELAKLPPERRARIEAKTDELHREVVAIRKLREMLNLT